MMPAKCSPAGSVSVTRTRYTPMMRVLSGFVEIPRADAAYDSRLSSNDSMLNT